MLANRRYGFLVRPDDALRASNPPAVCARRSTTASGCAILETIAFGRALSPDEPTFTDGAGI